MKGSINWPDPKSISFGTKINSMNNLEETDIIKIISPQLSPTKPSSDEKSVNNIYHRKIVS